MSTTTIASLPEEILLTIFEYLDSPPPSQLKSRLEPTLDLTKSNNHIYKSISQVSHLWRRIILPLLFRYSRLRLDVPPRKEWSECSACGEHQPASTTIDHPVDEHHNPLFATAYKNINTATANHSEHSPSRGPNFILSTLHWASRIHHSLTDYLAFLQRNNLPASIHSFALLTNCMIEESQHRFPHRMAATYDYRYRAAADLWHQLFKAVPGLKRVVIVAPPADLACLTNCAIDLFGDWAFEDMGFHVLEVRVDSSPLTNNATPRGTVHGYGQLYAHEVISSTATIPSYVPAEYPGVAPSSILKIRAWSHLSLNEGSFLRAYGTYEYFERGPPSLIYSIKDCVSSNRRAWRPHSQSCMDLSALKSFTYTAILPFANHCDFRGLLPYIDELDIKLAPDPTSGILQDKDRVGKAELEDCWSEFFHAYRAITKPFRTFEIRKDGTPKLKKFICRDVSTPALVYELDEEFVPLCLPVWAEMEPGVFVRRETYPPSYGPEIM
ncbi:hypothetical protein M409DRAFT_17003 [Zasmidium cellare ATCC 36951]|uniref:F-box domain-containing protein n=1 Tax=Zasmidium cellare ATCC 36951 TaxID=1080233 RepID=A0A6A6D1V7_ZASCE|nr:uncharacterized protein M409DRAFT_17003 [Zasmidium cellare ATCC 36951]KAF2173053.1 hypothetical protein M409DRAFT_17003 [Zasmidium cellare ATCC 36951]